MYTDVHPFEDYHYRFLNILSYKYIKNMLSFNSRQKPFKINLKEKIPKITCNCEYITY